jgi:hypothetical protein
MRYALNFPAFGAFAKEECYMRGMVDPLDLTAS